MVLATSLATPEEIEVVGSPVDEDSLEHMYHSAMRFELQSYYGSGLSLEQVITRSPGVYAKRTGGFGSQTLLSVRGLSGSNVGIVLDNLPLSSVSFSAADLSLFPLELLEAVDIYRGDGPIRFQAPLGGLIHLQTRQATRKFELISHAGMGSNFNRSAHVAVLGKDGSWNYLASLAYRGTQGDFSFYNDKETLYTQADDNEGLRQNNVSDAAALHFSLNHDHASGSAQSIRGQTSYRVRGVPGPGIEPTQMTQAADWEASLRFESNYHHYLDHALSMDVGLDVLTSRRSFSDPGVAPDFLPELSMRAEQEASLWQVGLDTRLLWDITHAHRFEFSPRVATTYFQQTGDENAPTSAMAALERLSLDLGIGVEHLWTPVDGLTIGPAIRLDAWFPNDTDAFSPETFRPEVSPRLVVHVALEPCNLYLNTGRRHRYPTLLERYGDNIGIGPSPGLESESGLFADAGGRCHLELPENLSMDLALTGFGSFPENLIAFVQNSQKTVKAMNISQSKIMGFESSLKFQHTWATAQAHYSWIAARDSGDVVGLQGKTPPGIPQHQLDVLLMGGPKWLQLGWELNFTSKRYLDRANLTPIAQAAMQAVFVHGYIESVGVRVKARLDNLTDLRKHSIQLPGSDSEGIVKTADMIGYPLPGRTIFVGVTWEL